jgi:ribosomal protein S21
MHVYVGRATLDTALRRLKKKLEKEGVPKAMKRGEYAMSRGQRKRAKHTKVLALFRKAVRKAS